MEKSERTILERSRDYVIIVFLGYNLIVGFWAFAQQNIVNLSNAAQRAQQLEQQLNAEKARAAAAESAAKTAKP